MSSSGWMAWAGVVIWSLAFGIWAHWKGERDGYDAGYADAVDHLIVVSIEQAHDRGEHAGRAFTFCRQCSDRAGQEST